MRSENVHLSSLFNRIFESLLPDVEGEQQYRARLVLIAGLTLIFLGAFLLLVQLYQVLFRSVPAPLSDLALDAFTLVIGVVMVRLVYFRKINTASWIVFLCLWLVTTVQMYFDGEPFSDMAGAFGYFIAITLAVVLLDARDYWISILLVVGSYVGLFLLWGLGYLPEPFPRDMPGDIFFSILAWLITVLFVVIVVSSSLNGLRKQAKLARESEKRYELIMTATNDGIYDWDIQRNQTFFNDNFFQILGFEPEDFPHDADTFERVLHPDDLERARENLQRYFDGDDSAKTIELRLKTKDGGWKWILSRGKTVEFDEQGNPTRFLGTNVDIDERKKMEYLIEEERDRAQLYLDIAPVMFMGINAQGRIVLANPKLCEVLKMNQAELIGKDFFDVLLPETGREESRKNFDKIKAKEMEMPEFTDRLFITSEGEERLIALRNTVIWDAQGNFVETLSSGDDISERRQAEEALRLSEERYRLLYQSAKIAVVFYTAEGTVISFNEFALNHMNMQESDVVGKDIREFFSDDETNKLTERIRQVATTRGQLESEDYIKLPTGERWFYSIYSPVTGNNDELFGVQVVSLDITEKKEAEEALQTSEQMLNKVGEIAQVGGWEIDLATEEFHVTPALRQIFEFHPDQKLDPGDGMAHYTPESRTILMDALTRLREEGEEYDLELELITHLGNHRWVRAIGLCEYEDGRMVRIWGTLQDISVLKDAADKLQQYSQKLELMVEGRTNQLRESEQRYRRLSESANEAIFIHNQGIIVELNQAFIDLFGYREDEIIGKNGEILATDGYKDVWQNYTIENEEPYEIIMEKKDGAQFPAWVVGRQIPYGGEMYRVVIVRDLSERKAMEEQLIQAERLATLGRLAGSVGHELRNPLGAIKNATYFLNLMDIATTPDVIETLQIINQEVDRSNKIIKDLLDFTRVRPPKYNQVDINRLLLNLLSALEEIEGVEFEPRLAENLPIIRADDYQLAQVFDNLFWNAIQSMPMGGRVIVESHTEDESQVRIVIQDTGEGIPNENREKIFEPLFTTKAQGIGLGLPLVKTLIEGHEGTIEFESQPGEGSIFTVYLPILE